MQIEVLGTTFNISAYPGEEYQATLVSGSVKVDTCLLYTSRVGIHNGAISAPMVEPALNMEVEKARSFFGKYSAVTLMAAGKFPASPMPSMIRAAMKLSLIHI